MSLARGEAGRERERRAIYFERPHGSFMYSTHFSLAPVVVLIHVSHSSLSIDMYVYLNNEGRRDIVLKRREEIEEKDVEIITLLFILCVREGCVCVNQENDQWRQRGHLQTNQTAATFGCAVEGGWLHSTSSICLSWRLARRHRPSRATCPHVAVRPPFVCPCRLNIFCVF